MNPEVPWSQRISHMHCHATNTQAAEPENTPGKKVLHTHLGKDFAKDYSKGLMKQIGWPKDDEEKTALQNEGFRYDIIDHLSWVPAKASLLHLIKMNRNMRMSLGEALSEQRK